jgi:hypothetical protein
VKTDERFYHPGSAQPEQRSKVADRKARFAALNKFVTERQGWIISLPGHEEVRIECLPGSALPNDLRGLGYRLLAIEDGERILAGAIVEKFVRRADGDLEQLTAGSTKPVAEVRRHAGIVRTERYTFDLG